MTAPSVVVMSNDYAVGEGALFGGAVSPPVYSVTPGSVYYDSKYDGQEYDFCMLKFAAPAGTPVIPVPGASDGLSLGAEVEHVGFGVTESNGNNSGRRTGSAPVNQQLTSLVLESSQGGASHIQGVCEGDSGGPALFPAGVPQAQQKVVGTTSFGDSSTCAQNTTNVCMRVTSEIGATGFITTYLDDNPVGGTQAGSAQASCQTCVTSSESGACASQAQACGSDQACLTLNQCLGNCTDQSCITGCESAAGQTAINQYNAFVTCVCQTACTSECAADCGGSSSSSSSSSGGANCGLMSSDANCNACLDASCCSQAQACVNDATCSSCIQSASPPASCGGDAAYVALGNCLGGPCGTACGGGFELVVHLGRPRELLVQREQREQLERRHVELRRAGRRRRVEQLQQRHGRRRPRIQERLRLPGRGRRGILPRPSRSPACWSAPRSPSRAGAVRPDAAAATAASPSPD